jgi:hypothetical protein
MLKMYSNTERLAWTSESSTGMFNAWKHRHRRPREGDDPIMYNYYGRTVGFATRSQAADLLEN